MKGSDNSAGTSLKNSFKQEVFALAPVKAVDLSEASEKLDNIKKEFASVQQKIKNLSGKKTEKAAEPAVLSEATATSENIIYEAPKTPGIFARAWQFVTSMLH